MSPARRLFRAYRVRGGFLGMRVWMAAAGGAGARSGRTKIVAIQWLERKGIEPLPF